MKICKMYNNGNKFLISLDGEIESLNPCQDWCSGPAFQEG